jgi:hypothetical protein
VSALRTNANAGREFAWKQTGWRSTGSPPNQSRHSNFAVRTLPEEVFLEHSFVQITTGRRSIRTVMRCLRRHRVTDLVNAIWKTASIAGAMGPALLGVLFTITRAQIG